MTPRSNQLVHTPRPNLKTRILQPLGARAIAEQLFIHQAVFNGNIPRERGDSFRRVERE